MQLPVEWSASGGEPSPSGANCVDYHCWQCTRCRTDRTQHSHHPCPMSVHFQVLLLHFVYLFFFFISLFNLRLLKDFHCEDDNWECCWCRVFKCLQETLVKFWNKWKFISHILFNSTQRIPSLIWSNIRQVHWSWPFAIIHNSKQIKQLENFFSLISNSTRALKASAWKFLIGTNAKFIFSANYFIHVLSERSTYNNKEEEARKVCSLQENE